MSQTAQQARYLDRGLGDYLLCLRNLEFGCVRQSIDRFRVQAKIMYDLDYGFRRRCYLV